MHNISHFINLYLEHKEQTSYSLFLRWLLLCLILPITIFFSYIFLSTKTLFPVVLFTFSLAIVFVLLQFYLFLLLLNLNFFLRLLPASILLNYSRHSWEILHLSSYPNLLARGFKLSPTQTQTFQYLLISPAYSTSSPALK